jgi:hypothetical protein
MLRHRLEPASSTPRGVKQHAQAAWQLPNSRANPMCSHGQLHGPTAILAAVKHIPGKFARTPCVRMSKSFNVRSGRIGAGPPSPIANRAGSPSHQSLRGSFRRITAAGQAHRPTGKRPRPAGPLLGGNHASAFADEWVICAALGQYHRLGRCHDPPCRQRELRRQRAVRPWSCAASLRGSRAPALALANIAACRQT